MNTVGWLNAQSNWATVPSFWPAPIPVGIERVVSEDPMSWLKPLIACLVLTGCATHWSTDYAAPLDAEVTRTWHVHEVDVLIPEKLTVSDENLLMPPADIVWHGDPDGDRRAQVSAILNDGIAAGTTGLVGDRPVKLEVVLREFHGVTPIAMVNAPSAVYNIHYSIRAVDADTGAALTEPAEVDADLAAHVGADLITASLEGSDEKSRLREHLAEVTAGWLGIGPDPREEFTSVGR
ncbi:hypothetical protein OEZ60_12985 [Defluviimonas sp. WL0024]|uniref:DUF3313 domain-containing protein n=1 Tax=Albidovulum salinarum TaxID=2984153 RepID=A0ABT2XB05_9RHOB|nr:DUF6778 family protein [Defluviimonas sp. WL0024]MCU9848920.1 hypothetical protein [Defluviimonas sp. WL0024]